MVAVLSSLSFSSISRFSSLSSVVESLEVMTGASSQLSVAVAGPPVSGIAVDWSHSTVTSAGQLITGAVRSR